MRRALRAAVVLPLVLGACDALPWPGGGEVPLGSGTIGSASWSAVAVRSAEDGPCVMVRFEGQGDQSVCRGFAGGPLGVNVITVPGGGGAVVIVEVMEPTMVKGSITFADRPGSPVDVVDGGILGRYALGSYVGDERPLELLLRDETGRSRETRSLR